MNYKPQDLNYCLVLCSWSFKSGLDVTYHTLAGSAVGKNCCSMYVFTIISQCDAWYTHFSSFSAQS